MLTKPLVAAIQPSTDAAPLNALDPMLGEQEVAATLGVALNTLRNWRWKGEGPRWCKLGKRAVRYRTSAVQQFIEAGTERAA